MNSNDIHGMALALGLPSAIAQIEAVKLLVAEAVANEREACAKTVENLQPIWNHLEIQKATLEDAASAIRARSISRGEA
jgi:hypothetical protein